MTKKRLAQMPSLERLAEALILSDPGEPGSLGELSAAFEGFLSWAERGDAPADVKRAAAGCVAVATAMNSAGPTEALRLLGELGHGFEHLQRVVTASGASIGRDASSTGGGSTRAGSRGRAAAELASEPEPKPEMERSQVSVADDPALIADFVTRATEILESADERLVELEREVGRRDLLDDVFRLFHTLKGMAGFLSLDAVQTTAHAAETILDAPRHGEARLEERDLEALFQSVDELKCLVLDVGAVSGARQGSGGTSAVDERPSTGEAGGQQDDEGVARHLSRATIRVDEGRLDRLLDAIGEMVIAESMASETVKTRGDHERLVQQLARLDKITRELQELATSLRMMPIGATFRRMGRLVRDLSHRSGKSVEFVVFGQETELDKEMVDRLSDPLIHLLRNAIDHGIEPPDVRVRAGKPPTGRVELRAFHQGGTVFIEVADDGRGLDVDAIAARARQRGLLGDHEELDHDGMLALILEPGFSTASQVTDISGRGVGMDVVQRVAEDLRGEVEVSSVPGQGTRFTVRLPLTLAIIDGMALRVGAERYIIPTGSIQRSVRPDPADITPLLNRGSFMSDSEGVLPLLHLGRLFGEHGAIADPSQAIVVICESQGRRVGLVACEILGQQQTVIKGLGDDLRGAPGLAGGAIMSDGRVGLILDVAGLVRLANSEGGE